MTIGDFFRNLSMSPLNEAYNEMKYTIPLIIINSPGEDLVVNFLKVVTEIKMLS